MKQLVWKYILGLLLISTTTMAQQGIGTNEPNPAAALHISSPDKGVLLPKIGLASSTLFLGGITASASHTGMLVYNTNTVTSTGLSGEGYYFWNGSQWEKFTGQGDLFWDLDRDTGVQVEEGTDDDTIRFDTAGVERAVITNTGNVGIGTANPSQQLDVEGNAEIGTVGEELFIGNVGHNNAAGIAHKTQVSSVSYALLQQDIGTTVLNSSHSVRFRINNTDHMRLNNNGTVNIGQNFQNSSPKLGVYNNTTDNLLNVTASTGSTTSTYISQSSFSVGNSNNGLYFMVDGAFNGRRAALQVGHVNRNFANRLGKFSINPLGGFVGIGVLDPTIHLDVNGRVRLRTLPAGAATDQVVTADANGNLRKRTFASIGSDDQNISGSGLSGTTLTIGIEGGSNETVDLISLRDGDAWGVTGEDLSSTISRTGNVGIGGASGSEKLKVTGDFYNTGGAKLVVQGGVNGGSNRGIFMWTNNNTSWGINLASSGAGKSLGGGNATTGVGFTNTSLRFRVYKDSSNGVIFENSNEELLASIRGSDGLSYFAGDMGIGVTPTAKLDVNGRARIRTLPAGAATDQVVTADTNGNLRSLSISSLGTDSQTLAIGTTTTTETLLTLENSQALTLTASGSLSFNRTSSSTLELIGDASQLIDADGDTQIQVEEGSDDDTIRLDAGNVEVATFTSSDTVIFNSLTASGTLTANATTTLKAALVDGLGTAGTAGQLLSSTGTSTNWVDNFAPIAGTVNHATLRWNGTAWVENDQLLSNGTNTTSLTTDFNIIGDTTNTGTLAVTGNTTVTGDLLAETNATVSATFTAQSTASFEAAVLDANGKVGMPGQLLSSTGTSTTWINAAVVNLRTVTTDTTLTITDGTVVVRATSTTAINLTLPIASALPVGGYLIVKRLDNGATPTAVNVLAGNATDTIDGNINSAYTTQLTNNAAKMTLQSDGVSAWYIISQ